MYLPQKPDVKKDTIMKKSDSANIISSQNNVKQEIIKSGNKYGSKKNISKSWVDYNYDNYVNKQLNKLNIIHCNILNIS